jgi:hypothetical protein
MSVTLEKVDEVRNRTGASYSEAKEALEFTGGDVLEAIVYIEQMRQEPPKKDAFTDDLSDRGSEIIEKLKELVKKGQVTRILLQKDGNTVLDIPIVAGAVGALIFTGATAVGILAALATGCELMIVKENDDIIDIREILEDTAETVQEIAEEVMKGFSTTEATAEGEDEPASAESQTEASYEDVEFEEKVEEDEVVTTTFIQPDEPVEEEKEED